MLPILIIVLFFAFTYINMWFSICRLQMVRFADEPSSCLQLIGYHFPKRTSKLLLQCVCKGTKSNHITEFVPFYSDMRARPFANKPLPSLMCTFEMSIIAPGYGQRENALPLDDFHLYCALSVTPRVIVPHEAIVITIDTPFGTCPFFFLLRHE